MTVAVMLAVGPIAILCNFFGITRFVFEGWVKGIAFGIFTLLFSYIIAGFCFGFVRSYLNSIQIATATQEGILRRGGRSGALHAGGGRVRSSGAVIGAFVCVWSSVFRAPCCRQRRRGIEKRKEQRLESSQSCNEPHPEGITGNAVRGTMAMATWARNSCHGPDACWPNARPVRIGSRRLRDLRGDEFEWHC